MYLGTIVLGSFNGLEFRFMLQFFPQNKCNHVSFIIGLFWHARYKYKYMRAWIAIEKVSVPQQCLLSWSEVVMKSFETLKDRNWNYSCTNAVFPQIGLFDFPSTCWHSCSPCRCWHNPCLCYAPLLSLVFKNRRTEAEQWQWFSIKNCIQSVVPATNAA